MDKLPAGKIVGVVLVDNIPPKTTASQLSVFFTEMEDVSSIRCIASEGADKGSCWLHVSKPEETVPKINTSKIAGEKIRARLMGYLFSA
jgi:hypothetical protein